MSEPRVLYEDERVIALDKPSRLETIPGRGPGRGQTLLDIARALTGARVLVVHRIDRETSGVVLFAKDAAAHRELSLRFERREVAKLYLAAARGELRGEGAVDAPLRQFGSGRVAVDPRLMLHALELGFSLEGAERKVRAEPPADFLAVLDGLRGGV